ncbi:MAG: peroxiredoxin [Alphaproteobacteria bacterium]|nr:peroxiredoxin [Alphaproteobacteria bacterium]
MDDILDLCDCSEQFSMPLIGDRAPSFVASTTDGVVTFPDDFAGKWVVLFSHPSDFTPVCTTEFIAFQNDLKYFEEINTKLLGLSVGTLSSHLAWFDSISKMYNGATITFPLIDDMNMQVAKLYGMIHENASNTSAVRAVFIIDPKGTIRAILYYPSVLGRNLWEIRRMIIGLQTSDAFGVGLPVNWEPGDDVLCPAPTTNEAMRKHGGVSPWFLKYKELAERDIYEKICKKHGDKK